MEPSNIEINHIVDQYIAVSEVDGLNYEEMINFVEKESIQTPSREVSNIGGYQTETYRLSEKHQEFRDEYLKIGGVVSTLGCNIFQNNVACDLDRSFGFFNKITRGNSHGLHRHTGMISSILYLNDGEGFSTTHFVPNTTYSTDDLMDINKNPLSGYAGDAPRGIVPKRGLLLMFPSHLLHRVSEHNSDTSRYTFACNWVLVQVEE